MGRTETNEHVGKENSMHGKHLVWCLGAAALLIPASVSVVTREQTAAAYVRCDDGAPAAVGSDRGPLQRAIDTSLPGGFIVVSGTCDENVMIPSGKDGLTLDGGGTAAIIAADSTQPAVLVRARDVTVRAFAVTGGYAIEVLREPAVVDLMRCTAPGLGDTHV
jgi:hypothetical protein